MNLSEFTTSLTTPDNGYGQFLQTKTGGKLHDIIRNEGKTENLLASFFWQIMIRAMGIPIDAEMYVVPHGNAQYSLVLFGPNEMEPRSISLVDETDKEDLLEGYALWRHQMQNDLKQVDNTGYLQEIISQVDEDYAIEINRKMNMQMIFATKPEIVYTDTLLTTLGSPCPVVTAAIGGKPLSTAGIFTSDNQGRFGATVAWHSVKDILINTTQIYINDESAQIVSTDQISDSCFAVFDQPVVKSAFNNIGGTLSGLCPRPYDPVTFQGITSGFKQTIITGLSPDIPCVLPYSQLKVMTAPETNPGDSGAALIDRDGKVMGFSFYRTAINQQPEYSCWIWADSVYKAHNLMY
ncbi:hypothetical protein GFS24_25870 [Chitinophaga sp. SYP-B3965]|uniref:hypothetical protein n=1 Tax=Chitinophaga sp. SYP-B3965 TaxID=2663120 RepID=UPI00129965F0|nr:hypothetical protein [Chitinophaga sp. SYP-B3965]MRG48571.1 hypothetical protein [Chitinophaga sp. SYP-B3965]